MNRSTEEPSETATKSPPGSENQRELAVASSGSHFATSCHSRKHLAHIHSAGRPRRNCAACQGSHAPQRRTPPQDRIGNGKEKRLNTRQRDVDEKIRYP